jgi:hypothetical protein
MTIACVLRTGRAYSAEWVWALKRGIARHMSLPYRAWRSEPVPDTWTFVCLTNAGDLGGMGVPFAHDWLGWWSKMELFRPGLFDDGPVLYLDLDTLVVGDLAPFASYAGDLALLSDFYRPALGQSGVMLFRPGDATERLWVTWLTNPEKYMRRYRGDGEWLHAHTVKPERVQTLYPGTVASFKVEARDGAPDGAALVCAHGKPKFNDPAAGWAHREWVSLARRAA